MSRLLPFQSDADVPEDRAPRVVDLDGEDAEKVFGALSSETARAIFQSIHDDPMTASDIADAVDSSIQNVRYHLEKLEDAGLVEVVDTWYSSRGNEMKVYAPKDGPLIVSSDETRASRIRTALSRLVGGVGVLAAASVLIQYGANNLFFGVGSAPRTQGAGGSGDGAGGGAAAPADDGEYDVTGAGNASGDSTTEAATETAEAATETAAESTTSLSSGDGGGDGGDGGGLNAQDAETTTVAEESTRAKTTEPVMQTDAPTETAVSGDGGGTSVEYAAKLTETVQDAATTTAASGGGSGFDVGGLEPGLMFFLGGLVVLLALVAYQYRSSPYR